MDYSFLLCAFMPTILVALIGAVNIYRVASFQRPQSWKCTSSDGQVTILTGDGTPFDNGQAIQIGYFVLREGDKVEKVNL